jgi:hypothetical protein
MNLALLDSACEVYNAVQSVTGLATSSASPTDIYIINCKPDVKFGDNPVSHIFVKLCVSVSSITPEMFAFLEPFLPERKGMSKQELLLKRLTYAQAEYSAYDVVKHIYLSHMCPFFVRVYGVGFNCTYRQLRKLLKRAEHNFKRNIWYSLTNNVRRPAIDEDTKEDDSLYNTLDPKENLRFNLLLLQYVEHPSFMDLLLKRHYNNNITLLLKMVFMVGYACYALNLNNLCHKDLHLRNVLIEPCPVRTLVLIIDSRAYELTITEFPRLFDFDRSKGQPCATSALDLFYFVGFFAASLESEATKSLAKCFMNPFMRGFKRLVPYWQQPVLERQLEDTNFFISKMETLPNVLYALSKLIDLPIISLESARNYADVFIARRDVVDTSNVREFFFSKNR